MTNDELVERKAEPVQPEYGYMRIVEVFDRNETAGAFLSEDGEGGFAAGVSRMADEIDRLRAALSAAPEPVTVEGGGNAVPQTLDEIIENSLRMWYFNYDPSLDHTAARIAMREIIRYVIDVARVSPASPSPVDSRDDRDFEWKLVPIKPTLEMAEKGAEAFSLPHPQSVGAENERAALIYRLMLSASPSARIRSALVEDEPNQNYNCPCIHPSQCDDSCFSTSPAAPVTFDPDEWRDEMSAISSYLGAGMGDDQSTAADLAKRIRWGIDEHVNGTIRMCASVVERLSQDKPYSHWGEVKSAILELAQSDAVHCAQRLEFLSASPSPVGDRDALIERLQQIHDEQRSILGQMLLDKSEEGQRASNWQGGKVNGIASAIAALAAKEQQP